MKDIVDEIPYILIVYGDEIFKIFASLICILCGVYLLFDIYLEQKEEKNGKE